MADTRLRELERRYRESGALADRDAWLDARVRGGLVPRQQLEAAAYLGHPAASTVVGDPAPADDDLRAWLEGLLELNEPDDSELEEDEEAQERWMNHYYWVLVLADQTAYELLDALAGQLEPPWPERARGLAAQLKRSGRPGLLRQAEALCAELEAGAASPARDGMLAAFRVVLPQLYYADGLELEAVCRAAESTRAVGFDVPQLLRERLVPWLLEGPAPPAPEPAPAPNPAEQAALVERVRARLEQGAITPERVQLAARLSDPVACQVLGTAVGHAPTELAALLFGLRVAGLPWLVRAGAACARYWLAVESPPSERLAQALEVVEAWVLCPCAEHEEQAAWAAADTQQYDTYRTGWGVVPWTAKLIGRARSPNLLAEAIHRLQSSVSDEDAAACRRAVAELTRYALGEGDPLRERASPELLAAIPGRRSLEG